MRVNDVLYRLRHSFSGRPLLGPFLGAIFTGLLLILLFSSSSTALIDLPIFGPKRYDRLKGKPTVYNGTFANCAGSSQAILLVTNGDSKTTRIRSAEIFINGTEVASEDEFQMFTPYFEKNITTQETNDIRVVLKGGKHDEISCIDDPTWTSDPTCANDPACAGNPPCVNPGHQSFLIIEIIGKGCDSAPPVIANPEPADGSLVKSATPRIAAQYADEAGGSGIDTGSVKLVLDGKDVTSSAAVTPAGVSYTPSSNLSEGLHTVTVGVSDLAQNPASLAWSFTTDTIAPVVSITSHQNDQYLKTPTVTISGTIDDPTATVTVNGQNAQVSGNSYSYAGLSLTEGPNTITVSATDPAGNTGTATININLDTQAPAITISTPGNNIFVSTPSITVAGSINEPVTSLAINGTAVTPTESNTFSLAAFSLIEGENTITVTATDRAGNIGTASVKVFLDTIAPVITITSHQHGQYLNTPVITLSGTVNEPIIEAKVNGANAQIDQTDTTRWSISGVSLVEGANTITATVKDRAGNPGTTSITLNLDTIAPNVTITSHQTGQFVNTPKVTISGTVSETVTSVLVNGTAAAVNQDNTWTLADAVLIEGLNTIIVSAPDRAGNSGTATITLTLDTVLPVINVTTPVHNSYVNTPKITLSGTVTEANPDGFWVNDQEQQLTNGSFSIPDFSLTSGINVIRFKAKDKAGNESAVSIMVTLDTTSPSVLITAPLTGSITNNALTAITGTVNEVVQSVTINGQAAQVSGSSFTLANFTLAEGDNTLFAEAVDRAGNSGSASITVTLDTQAPQVTMDAPGQAAAGTHLSLSTSASDDRGLSLSEVRVNGTTVWSFSPNGALNTQNSVLYSTSPDLASGATLMVQARVMDVAGNIGTATANIQIVGGPTGPGYIQGEVYDDSRGLRLEGATADFLATDGRVLTRITTQADGGYFTEAGAGNYLVTLAKAGHTTVERFVAVRPEKNAVAIDARLTPIHSQQNLIDSNGAVISVPLSASSAVKIELDVPSGALTEQTDIRLTPMSNQGLAGIVPAGWSPIAAVDIRDLPRMDTDAHGYMFAQAATLKVPVVSGLSVTPSSSVTLVSYDAATHQWLVQNPGTVSADGATITASISSTGQYAFVLPDDSACTSIVGSAIIQCGSTPNSALSTPDSISASGKVVPPAAPPSAGLKAVGEVVLSASDTSVANLVSGLIVNARVTERFDLFSGEVVLPSEYVQDLVMYRYPCITNFTPHSALRTPHSSEAGSTFPVSPSHEYTITELMLGKVGIEVNLRPEEAVTGTMVGSDGARLLDSDGTVLFIPQNALTQTVPVETRTVEPSTISGIVGSDFTLLRAIDVNLTGRTLASSAELSIPAPAGLNTGLPIIVAKAIEVRGAQKLKLVALGTISGSLITSSVSSVANSLSGIVSSGTYFFLQSKAPLGFITGTVKDSSGNPYASALTTSSTCSLVDLTVADGKYLIAGTVAAFTATATDIYRNDVGSSAGAITAADQAVTANITIQVTPPRVVSLTPADNATGIEPNASIVITFSEAVDKTTITSANIVLKDADNNTLPGVFSINTEGTVVTLYPSDVLKSETKHTVLISRSIRDLQGYLLGADVTSSFTVRDTTPPPLPPAGSVTGTFPDADGYVTITGTRGSADATGTVLIINDMTGETVAVNPESNGSFSGRIRAQLGDEIRIVLMDAAGNQTLISYITFKSEDGRYLVTARGGTVEGEGGIMMVVPEGALFGPTVIKITPLAEDQLPHPMPQKAGFLAGVNIDAGGASFQKPVKLSVPAPSNLSDMPEGSMPFVSYPTELVNADGTTEKVYVIADSAKVVDGRLTTASPPFTGVIPGIQVGSNFAFAYPYFQVAVASGYTYREMDGNHGYNPQSGDLPIKNAVIRVPSAYELITYSRSDGSYGAFAEVMVNVPGYPCRNFYITAIHPLTMRRVSAEDAQICEQPYNIVKYDFELANATTYPPDTAAPVIELNLKVASEQDQDHLNARFVAGTIPVGTNIDVPVSVIDQSVSIITLTVDFDGQGQPSQDNIMLTSAGSEIHAPVSADNPALISRFKYQPQFAGHAIGSPIGNYFQPQAAGTYTFTVVATDGAGHSVTKIVKVRAEQQGTIGTPVDGPPKVDKILPVDGSSEILVDMPVTVYFSEPVINVGSATILLFDITDGGSSGTPIGASVYPSLENGRMKATLYPNNNLAFAHKYKVVVTTGITDDTPNPSANNALLPLDQEYTSVFETKKPVVYDASGAEQMQGAGYGGIALYTHPGTDRTFAYVAANDKGWYAVDVTDPTAPFVTYRENWSQNTVSFRYRGVAVDQQTGIVGITEWIQWLYPGGGQYGYVRFYDALSDPTAPGRVGQERLAEAASGVPDKISIVGNYAFITTLLVGLQVVDIDLSKNYADDYGASIVSAFDTVNLEECPRPENPALNQCGSPSDLEVYKGIALIPTFSGHLLVLDVNMPQYPSLITAYRPEGYSARRIAVAPDYAFTDSEGNTKVIDLAVNSGNYPQGNIFTVDVTDPHNLGEPKPVKDKQGIVVQNIYATDISINKTVGLAYATAGTVLYVIDIKDPFNPVLIQRLENVFTDPDNLTPDATLGLSFALAEKDGWVYLLNQQKGLRTLNLDPVFLTPVCKDEEPGLIDVSRQFCFDYYPALGWKTITLQARGPSSWKEFVPQGTRVRYKASNFPPGFRIRPEGASECTAATVQNGTCATTITNTNGLARFYVKTEEAYAQNRVFLDYFEVDPASIAAMGEQLSGNFVLDNHWTSPILSLRHNGNVTMGEVLSGDAVFVYDDTDNVDRLGSYRDQNQDAQDEQKRFYFVQELLNQVVPRKRNLDNPTNPGTAYNYTLMDEDGNYGPSTYNRLIDFKHNFDLGVNDTVGPYPYDSNINVDNTSAVFRKLMKDYGRRRQDNPWLIDGAAADSWLHKVIDKDTLIKATRHIPLSNEQITTDNADVLINGATGNTRDDTGLYELYKNVVERFNDRMIRLDESYERNANPDNGLGGQPGQWVPRQGPAQVKTNNTTPLAVAYSYGGRMTIRLFNDIVSRHSAPSTNDFTNNATYRTYRGRIGDVADDMVASFPHGNIGGGNRKWPGLLQNGEYFDWYNNSDRSDNHHFYHGHWAGIDCIGLTLQGLRYVDTPGSYAADQILADVGDTSIPGIRVGSVCMADNNCQNTQNRVAVHTYRGLMDTNVRRFFDVGNPDLLFYWERTDASTALIRRGDFVRYGTTHISTVHSNRPNCVHNQAQAACTYEIMHAYGPNNGLYQYPDIAEAGANRNQTVFGRKVIRTFNNIAVPTGFGRIKLWD